MYAVTVGPIYLPRCYSAKERLGSLGSHSLKESIMPLRRDFRAKKTLNVVSFKVGKAVRKSKLSVPIGYSIQQATDSVTASPLASTSSSDSLQQPCDDLPVDFEEESTGASKKAKVHKSKIKRKLKANHVRKERLAASWLNVRNKLLSALLTRPFFACWRDVYHSEMRNRSQ